VSSVTLRDIYKRYRKVEAVRGISLEIARGEFIALIGPSGCGKSSTMRMIAGLEEVTAGDILFDGESVLEKRPRDRNVAMSFETYALYPTLTVFENLAFPLRARGLSGAETDRRVRDVAEIVDITDLLERRPSRLSSGQAQLVGLARALVRKPSVFLLDEPISHLDTRQRGLMRAYIKRLHIDLGYTMVYVTHDQEEAMALADRVAVMDEGALRQVGTPREIYDNPADTFVAGFIGDPPMNFLEGKCVQEGDRYYLVRDPIRVLLPSQSRELGRQGRLPQDLVLGIRPIHILLSHEKRDAGAIPAEVFVVEPLGDMAVVSVNLDGTRFQAVAPPGFRAQPKDRIWIGLSPEHLCLFEKATGKALAS
jgi:multiple sugar transport system ATP-binding protein